MAGLGVKNFSAGDILTAADVNGYFMAQSVGHYDDAVARSAFFGANPALLFEGRLTYLRDTNSIWIYDGANWNEQTAIIADGSITATKLGTGAVTATKIGTGAVTENKIGTEAVTSDKIKNLTIVDGDISASASIALSKLATGALPSGITVASTNITNLTLKTEDIEDGAVSSDKLGSNLSLTGTTKIEEIFEKASISNASLSSPLTVAITDGAVYYYTASTTTNITLDITTTGMADQSAVTVLVAITSGSAAGKISLIKVNNATPFAIKWFGGNAYPAGSSSGAVDAYTVTVFRNGAQYTVFASQSKFA